MAGAHEIMIGREGGRHVRYMSRDESELPTFQRKASHSRGGSMSVDDDSQLFVDDYEEKKIHSHPTSAIGSCFPTRTSLYNGTSKSSTNKSMRSPWVACVWAWAWRWSWQRLLLLVIVSSFLLGYYAQVLVFFFHVRLGFVGEILPTTEVALTAKFTQSLIEHTRRVVFVCRKTNWDFVGFIASPHTVLFAHDDVKIPLPLEETLSVVRHSGVDSYLNLHNKTITIMSHVHRANDQHHFFKQDDEAVVYWPHYYQCMKQCKNLSTCYAGDMHVNIGDATNSNSYVFATGGSYFLGNDLLRCILANPVFVRLDGLDYGEDKTVGKMIHYNKCDVQYVSCKWFNNKEVYSPHAVVKMTKGATERHILEDTVLLSQQEQAEANSALQVANAKLGEDGARNDHRTLQEAP